MWEFHLLKPSSWTPICHSRDLNISNQPPLTVSSQHPLLPPLLPTQCKEPVQRAFLFFYSCVCECDWAKFSAPVFQPVRSAPCTRLLQSRLKSSSWTAAGGRAAACVMNYIIYYIILLLLWIIALHSCWERTEPIPRFTVLLRGFTAWVLSGWGVQVSCRYKEKKTLATVSGNLGCITEVWGEKIGSLSRNPL